MSETELPEVVVATHEDHRCVWAQIDGPHDDWVECFHQGARKRRLTDVRPLRLVDPTKVVVLDPEDEGDRVRFAAAVLGRAACGPDEWAPVLRSLLPAPKPVKPDEPTGLGAVVVDREGAVWVHLIGTNPPSWWRSDAAWQWRTWDEVDVVEVLSPGYDTTEAPR